MDLGTYTGTNYQAPSPGNRVPVYQASGHVSPSGPPQINWRSRRKLYMYSTSNIIWDGVETRTPKHCVWRI